MVKQHVLFGTLKLDTQQTARESAPLGEKKKRVYETEQGNLVTPKSHGLPSHMNKEQRISTY